MSSAPSGIRHRSEAPPDVDTDLLILPVFEGQAPAAAVPGVNDAAGPLLAQALERREFQGRPFELYLAALAPPWRAARLALIGCGPASMFGTERLRRVATAAALAARQRRVQRAAFCNCTGLDGPAAVQAIAEGLALATFSGDAYKSGERAPAAPEELLVC